jgi:hypothetical protein
MPIARKLLHLTTGLLIAGLVFSARAVGLSPVLVAAPQRADTPWIR